MHLDAAWAAVLLTALAMAAALARWLWRHVRPLTRKLSEFLEDWRGEDARPGVPRRPGMPERVTNIETHLTALDSRLSTVEAEMQPDHGHSMKDQLTALAEHITDPNAHQPKGTP